MQHHPVPLKATLDSLPPLWPQELLPQIRSILAETPSMLFVLDDDPTGAQTVHNASFLTEWSLDVLLSEYHQPEEVTFLLTNSVCFRISVRSLVCQCSNTLECAS